MPTKFKQCTALAFLAATATVSLFAQSPHDQPIVNRNGFVQVMGQSFSTKFKAAILPADARW